MTPATVRALVDAAAATTPHAVYARATESDTVLTYAELQRGCRRVAAALAAQGVKPGDTVSLVMPNGLATLQWLLGAMHAGCAVNPVNLLSQADAMRYVLEHSDCRLVLASADWAPRVRELMPALPLLTVDPDRIELPESELDTPPPDAEAMALLMYTSGTTGRPKGVMLTQGNLAANARSIAAEHALGPADRVLGVLPLYHINAFAVTMLAPLASGGSVAMAPRFSVQRFWDQAIDSACTWINVVPTIIAFLLEAPPPPRAAITRLRFCRSASAALPPEHHRAFEAAFGIGIIETMGLTETVAPSFSNPLDTSLRKVGSVGRASGCEARVVDAQLQQVPDGTTGEITIRGPQVMRGYYKNPEATAAAFTHDGWLRTGDLGHRDGDGFFFVTGRIKELIIKGGENIAPREIDEALLQHPSVLDAAAVGIPDPRYGQEILACIVLRDGSVADEAELRAFCEQRLGRYKTPREFRFVSELPRGPSGKVQRLKLAEGAR
ncbi:MAG: AMP-binding protein [Rubrivivax sp.]